MKTEHSVSLVFRPTSVVESLNWTILFPKSQPIELELGSGDGSFLAQWAVKHPERNFIAVERLLGRLRKLDKKGLRAGLTNLRLLRLEASYVLQYLVPASSLAGIHVYFPDPWPKRKHRDRRLINESFTHYASASLRLGGVVWLRTDDTDYFDQMLSVFQAAPQFEACDTDGEIAAITTDFERGFNARGIPTFRAAFRKRSEATGPIDAGAGHAEPD